MIRKILFTLVFISGTTIVFGQTCYLPAPENWGIETFLFPIEFAPKIPYKGKEEVRFSPGWSDTKSEELWSYCFLWWIQADSKIDAASLKQHLEEYYGGLVSRNIVSRTIRSEKAVPTVVSFVEIIKDGNKEFTGTVDMLDYMSERPIKLNITVRLKDCTEQKMKAIFFSISPQSTSHPIWQQFTEVWKGFNCKKSLLLKK